MEPQEYFERVVRFLQTKGWNTSTSQVTDSVYVVTGTRESDTYYDRMLTIVAIDEETKLTGEHMEFLRNAAEQNDVDQMMATCRAGLDDDARWISRDEGIEFIEPATIDDAFIDEFSIEDGTVLDVSTGGAFEGAAIRHLTTILGLYLLVGVGYGSIVASLDLLSVAPATTVTGVLAGVVYLGGPLLAVIGGVADGARSQPLMGFLGSAIGYLLFVGVLAGTAFALGLTGSTGPFASGETVAGVGILAVPVGLVHAGVAILLTRFGSGPNR
jgi:hypothetical protein